MFPKYKEKTIKLFRNMSQSFAEGTARHLHAAIRSTNMLGSSTTLETIDALRPSQGIEYQLQEQEENKDNPTYPFFEED